jgi:hypothetical protein
MDDAKPPFQSVGSVTVPSGSNASVLWTGRANNTKYEWYATASDGANTVSLPNNSFTTYPLANFVPVFHGTFAPTAANPLFRTRYAGPPGATYTIERASNVNGPWMWDGNFTAPTTDQGLGMGVFEFTENPGTNAQAFFRLVFPSYPAP